MPNLLDFGVSIFNGISAFMGYLMPKPSLWKKCTVTIKSITEWEYGGSYLSQKVFDQYIYTHFFLV